MLPVSLSPLPGPLQAVVLEGNYWKRRIEVVMREYHKWRIYYKKRVSGGPRGVADHCRSRESPGKAPPAPASVKTQADSATVWPRVSSQPPGAEELLRGNGDPFHLGELVSRRGLGGK